MFSAAASFLKNIIPFKTVLDVGKSLGSSIWSGIKNYASNVFSDTKDIAIENAIKTIGQVSRNIPKTIGQLENTNTWGGRVLASSLRSIPQNQKYLRNQIFQLVPQIQTRAFKNTQFQINKQQERKFNNMINNQKNYKSIQDENYDEYPNQQDFMFNEEYNNNPQFKNYLQDNPAQNLRSMFERDEEEDISNLPQKKIKLDENEE